MRLGEGVLAGGGPRYPTRALTRSKIIAHRINNLDANIDQDIDHGRRIGGALSEICVAAEAADDGRQRYVITAAIKVF
jgi:hypothetical protein